MATTHILTAPRIALLAFFLIAVGVVFAAWSGDDVTDAVVAGDGPVVVFGDSLVAGVGVREGSDFVSRISRALDGRTTINAGVAGDTTALGRMRLDRDVLVHDPSIVIVLLGGNDALKRIPREETRANLAHIIAHLTREDAVVILLGIRGGLLRDAYEGMFEDLAREYGVLHIPDVLDGLFGNPDYMADPIHPNEAGHEIIAGRIIPVLSGLLEI